MLSTKKKLVLEKKLENPQIYCHYMSYILEGIQDQGI